MIIHVCVLFLSDCLALIVSGADRCQPVPERLALNHDPRGIIIVMCNRLRKRIHVCGLLI